jgi:hypothetical protein
MEFNFSPVRVALLVLLIAVFWLLGGFTPPEVPHGGWHDPARVRKAWTYCVLLYLAGAGCVSIVDHFSGNLDRTNFRFAYVLLGSIVMAASFFWIRHLAATVASG